MWPPHNPDINPCDFFLWGFFKEKVYHRKPENSVQLRAIIVELCRAIPEDLCRTRHKLCNFVKAGVSAIIDFTWTGWVKVQNMSSYAAIPYVRVDATISNYVAAVENYLSKRTATDAALIFHTETELDQTLYYLIGNSIIRVIALNKLELETTERLKKMRPTPSYYVIFADTENMNKLYDNAVKAELVVREERWNLVFTDFNYANFDKGKLTMATSLIQLKKSFCCKIQGRKPGCDCSSNIQIIPTFLKQAAEVLVKSLVEVKKSNNNIEPVEREQCEVEKQEDKKAINSFYANLNQSTTDPNIGVGFQESPQPMLFMTSDFDINLINGSKEEKLADWTKPGGLVVKNNVSIEQTRRFFRVGTAEGIPWSYMVRDSQTNEIKKDEKGNPIWEGYCIDLLKKLAEPGYMDFDYEIVAPANGSFGVRRSDGTWDGMVGDLAMGETDMIIAPLTMTSEREEVIDFVAPYFDQSGISIVIRKPVRETSLFKFMTVLRLEVWLSIVGALTVTGFMIWILDKYSPYSAQNNKELYPYPCREFTLKESFWFALTSFTPQGGGEAPKALSGRTLVAAYWLFVVLMLATFTANLAAFLTVERMKSPVQSLEQLARQSRINYTVVQDSDTHDYFKNMKNAEDVLYGVWKDITLNSSSDQSKYRVWDYPIKEQYGHILQAIEHAGPVPNASVGFRKVIEQEEGKFAFIHDAAQIRYEVSRNCNLTEVGEMFAEQPYAIAVQQGSHLQEEISRKILDLQKDRYFESLTAKFWNSSAKGDCPNSDDSEGITLESLGGVFIATIFGLALAMVTLAGEIFYYKRKRLNMVHAPDPAMENKKQITIGKEFRPAMDKTMPRVSYISVFPRNQLY
ncbi:ionotropic receptor 25a [Anabrus simplex]|uniref:ionotropic receptor 25a n=1 Tax=Anabrus simplex TaxID=316456 RepID=UPI0035A34F65